jgi:hypothetical protein
MSTSTRGFEHRYYKQRICYIMKPTVIVNNEQKYFRLYTCFVNCVGLCTTSSSNRYHCLRPIRRRTTIWKINGNEWERYAIGPLVKVLLQKNICCSKANLFVNMKKGKKCGIYITVVKIWTACVDVVKSLEFCPQSVVTVGVSSLQQTRNIILHDVNQSILGTGNEVYFIWLISCIIIIII